MCGLAGYVGTAPPDSGRIRACLDAMRVRGPDAEGVYAHQPAPGRHVCLLHSRLSIIDLDPRSNQPMRLGTSVLAINGEIYNYLEVAEAQRRGGVRHDTESDTEVLLRQLAAHGVAGLDACEGMWALAFYDEATGTLLLSRDRFGEKPLHLLETADGLYFGSEIKFLRILRGRRLQVDRDHVRRYLVNGYKALYKSPEDGFFRGVRPLAPASVLVVERDGRRVRRRYWSPDLITRDENLSYGDAVAEVREALVRSVELRLRADVPLAFLLSGGVDSNTLAAVARKALDHDVHGFSIFNTDPRYDEREAVGASVKELGIEHTPVYLGHDGFLEGLRAAVSHHDGPVATISWYIQGLLMEEIARQGYKISVSGTAADELFSGYYDHHLAYLYEVRGDADLHARSLAAWTRHIRPAVRNPHLSNSRLFMDDPDFRGHVFFDAEVFGGFLQEPWHEDFSEEHYTPGLLRNRMLNELFHETVPMFLHEDDLNAMSCSIENRSPYLDRQLAELTWRIPTRHLVRDGFAKAVLRDAAAGLAPRSVLEQRVKTGFNAPIEDLLDLDDPAARAAVLDDGPIFELVRRDRIEALLAGRHLPNSRSKFLFSFLNARFFMEEFA